MKELVGLIHKLTTHDAALPPDPDTVLPTPSPAQWAGIWSAGARVLVAYFNLPQASKASGGELFAMPL